jgi:hypothetical protein
MTHFTHPKRLLMASLLGLLLTTAVSPMVQAASQPSSVLGVEAYIPPPAPDDIVHDEQPMDD